MVQCQQIFRKFKLNYNFAVDNNLDEIEYNDINATLTLSNFSQHLIMLKN